MKTLTLAILLAVSAPLALCLLNFEIGISVLTAAGLLGIFVADYLRVLRPAAARASHPERFQLAA